LEQRWWTRLAVLFGIEIRVHMSVWILLALVPFFSLLGGECSSAGVAAVRVLVSAAFLLVLAGSVLLHELGHAGAAAAVGGNVRGILLHPLGGLAVIESCPHPTANLLVTLAGPVVNLALCGVLSFPGAPAFLREAASVNLALGLFNLLPVSSLDGGRALQTVLALKGVEARRIRRVLLLSGRVCGIGLGAVALAKGNLSLLVTAVVLWVLAHGAEAEGSLLAEVAGRVSRWMAFAQALLRHFLARLLPVVALGAVLALVPQAGGAEGNQIPSGAPGGPAEGGNSAGPAGSVGSQIEWLRRELAELEALLKGQHGEAVAARSAHRQRVGEVEKRLISLSLELQGLQQDVRSLEADIGRAGATEDVTRDGSRAKVRTIEKVVRELVEHWEAQTARRDVPERENKYQGVERLPEGPGDVVVGLLWVLTIAVVLGVVLVGWSILVMSYTLRNRVIPVQEQVRQTVNGRETLPAENGTAGDPLAAVPRQTNGNAPAPLRLGPPQRTKPTRVPEWTEKMEQVAEQVSRWGKVRSKPQVPEGLWNAGLATRKGNVRGENQDYGLAFTVGGVQILVVADGCGGIPNGGRAAFLAAVTAAESLSLAYGSEGERPEPCAAAAGAIRAAWIRLAAEGDKAHVSEAQCGLRTTLLVVVGDKAEYGFAYIGDGGGEVVRVSGKIERFLVPQKASDAPNVLVCSLGPGMQGEPMMGRLAREAGDLLLVGTDGVFDRVDGSFGRDVLLAVIQNEGDLQGVAEQVLDELVEMHDEAGYVCDDNVTLGLMATGAPPKLAPGFWDEAGT